MSNQNIPEASCVGYDDHDAVSRGNGQGRMLWLAADMLETLLEQKGSDVLCTSSRPEQRRYAVDYGLVHMVKYCFAVHF